MQMVVKTTTTPVDGTATTTTETLNFSYDASGVPMAVNYGGTDYYYVTNIQGDVMAILNTSGNAVVEYTYDAWGNIHTTTGTLAETLGEVNPLTYRGYVYDRDSDYYYLQSRYYDPEAGRFINGDNYTCTGQGLLGNNMFAYCGNNPTMCSDPMGEFSWIVIGLIILGGTAGLIYGGLSSTTLSGSVDAEEEKNVLNPSPPEAPSFINSLPRDHVFSPDKLPQDDCNYNKPNDATNEYEKLGNTVLNTMVGTSVGVMVAGATIALVGAVACVAAGPGVVLTALGATGLQTFALGAAIYNLAGSFIVPLSGLELEPIEPKPK